MVLFLRFFSHKEHSFKWSFNLKRRLLICPPACNMPEKSSLEMSSIKKVFYLKVFYLKGLLRSWYNSDLLDLNKIPQSWWLNCYLHTYLKKGRIESSEKDSFCSKLGVWRLPLTLSDCIDERSKVTFGCPFVIFN